MPRLHSTTILAVRHRDGVAIGGDGQVTLGNVVMKSDAHKIRRLHDGKVVVGFAGASADAFALLERFEAKLKDFQGSVPRAATELAKDWRMDRNLRRLEAMLIAVDRDSSAAGQRHRRRDPADRRRGRHRLRRPLCPGRRAGACWRTPTSAPRRSSAPPWKSPPTCAFTPTATSKWKKYKSYQLSAISDQPEIRGPC